MNRRTDAAGRESRPTPARARLLPALAMLIAGAIGLAPPAAAQGPSGARLQAFLAGKIFKYRQKGWDRYYWWEIRFYPGGQASSRAEGLKTGLTLRWHVRGRTLCVATVKSRTCHRIESFHPNLIVMRNTRKPSERVRLIRCYLAPCV